MKSSLRYKEKFEYNPYPKANEIYLGKDSKLVNIEDKDIVIVNNVSEENIKEAFVQYMSKALKLSNKAKSVLRYIMLHSKLTDDQCLINMDKLKETTGYNSLGPVYAGFNELIEAQLIARTKYDDQYFINPNFIFYDIVDLGIGNKYIIEKYTQVPEEETRDLPSGFDSKNMVDPGEDF